MKNKKKTKNQTPRFILSKNKLIEQVDILKKQGLKVSYSYKTNREVGKELQKATECDFSIHSKQELGDFSKKDLERVWFFTQAENIEEL